MIIAVDIGNTNIVLGCIDEGTTLFTERLSTNRSATALEYAILFNNTLSLHKTDASLIDGAIIASVVPQITAVVSEAIEKISSVKALIVGPGIKTGLNIRMDDPSSVGADLIAGAVGAVSKYKAPIIIIDMGTATTITAVDSRKNFIGGIIAPGVRVCLDSIVSNASMLQGISLKMPSHVIGSNTIDALRSGILMGSSSMIDGMIDRMTKELGEEATVVATGGWAKVVIPECRHRIILDDKLLIDGLLKIYERNRHPIKNPHD